MYHPPMPVPMSGQARDFRRPPQYGRRPWGWGFGVTPFLGGLAGGLLGSALLYPPNYGYGYGYGYYPPYYGGPYYW